MAWMDMRRGTSVEFSIVHVDVKIGEKSAPGGDALDPLQRPIEMGVGRMRPVAHGIDDQGVGVPHERERFLRQVHHVVDVEDVTEAESEGSVSRRSTALR